MLKEAGFGVSRGFNLFLSSVQTQSEPNLSTLALLWQSHD